MDDTINQEKHTRSFNVAFYTHGMLNQSANDTKFAYINVLSILLLVKK